LALSSITRRRSVLKGSSSAIRDDGCTSASALSTPTSETSIEVPGTFVVSCARHGGLEIHRASDSEGCHGAARQPTSGKTRSVAHRSGRSLGRSGSSQRDDSRSAPLLGHRVAGPRTGATTQPHDPAAASHHNAHATGRKSRVSGVWDLLSVAPRRTLGHLNRRAPVASRAPRSLPALSAGVFAPFGSPWASMHAN
jgi:hypothetical protein